MERRLAHDIKTHDFGSVCRDRAHCRKEALHRHLGDADWLHRNHRRHRVFRAGKRILKKEFKHIGRLSEHRRPAYLILQMIFI